MMRIRKPRALVGILAAAACLGKPRASLPRAEAEPGRQAALTAPAAPPAKAAKSADPGADLREEIRVLARRGLLDSALALCKRALEFDSKDVYATFMAGKLAPEGKASGEHFSRVLESGAGRPEAEESRFRLGQYHYAAGKYALAIPYFRDYLRLHPKGDWKEPAHYWMGSACLSLFQSRPDRAAYLDTGLVYFQRLLDLSPPENYYHALAWEGMAKIRLAKGDWEGAWTAARNALAKAPEDERASILLLAAQLRRNVDREEERRLLARLASEHPQSPEVRHLRRLNGHMDPSRWRAPAVPGAPKAPRADTGTRPETARDPGAIQPDAKSAAGPSPSNPSPPPSAAGAYTLQVGAFAQAANAQGMAADLTRMGFAPEMAESLRGGKKIYQVRLGRFSTADEALEYARLNLKPRKILSQALLLQP